MTRFVPLSDIIKVHNTEYALLITNRKDITEADVVLAQSDTEEQEYNVAAIQCPQGLKKDYAIYFLSEKVN